MLCSVIQKKRLAKEKWDSQGEKGSSHEYTKGKKKKGQLVKVEMLWENERSNEEDEVWKSGWSIWNTSGGIEMTQREGAVDLLIRLFNTIL